MKATEMLKQVKDLLGLEATEVNLEEQDINLEATKEETLATDKVEDTKVELATATLENGTTVEAEAFEAGNEIFIVTEDEKVALPVGEYTLEDGNKLTIEQEGIIASIGEAETEETEEVEAAADFATKEELAEVRKAVEDIVTMIEELGYGKKDEEMASEEVKEELSEVEKVKHNPESEEKTQLNIPSNSRPMNTLDRVMQTISNFN
jgi:NhaP-type Na+/H+ and K+/H+ antiporter